MASESGLSSQVRSSRQPQGGRITSEGQYGKNIDWISRYPGRRVKDYFFDPRKASPKPSEARGLGAANDPACLCDPARASRPGRRDNSACLRDSPSDSSRRLGAGNDLVRPRDAAKSSGPVRLANLGSLRDLIYGLGVRIIKSGSIIAAASVWPDNLRGTIWQKH